MPQQSAVQGDRFSWPHRWASHAQVEGKRTLEPQIRDVSHLSSDLQDEVFYDVYLGFAV